MPFCTQCGADVSGSKFCAQCGAPAPVADAAGAASPPAEPPPQDPAGEQSAESGSAAAGQAPGTEAAGAATSAPAAGTVPPTGGPEEQAPLEAPPATGSVDIAAALAYITPLAVLFLVIEPFSKDRLVRFHCMQSLLLFAVLIAGYIGLWILGEIFSVVGVGFVFAPLRGLLVLGFFVLSVLGAIKGFQGEKFHLPLVGEMAARKM